LTAPKLQPNEGPAETVSQEFLNELEATYAERLGPTIAESQSIKNQQTEGETLYAVDESELYATGQRAREAYSALTEDLLKTIDPR